MSVLNTLQTLALATSRVDRGYMVAKSFKSVDPQLASLQAALDQNGWTGLDTWADHPDRSADKYFLDHDSRILEDGWVYGSMSIKMSMLLGSRALCSLLLSEFNVLASRRRCRGSECDRGDHSPLRRNLGFEDLEE